MCQNKFPVKIGTRLSPGGREYAIYEYVSCRKCEECVSIRRQQWSFRILHESNYCYNSGFLTLTYDNDHLPHDGVSIRDIQLFFKRVRRNIQLWYPQFDVTKYPLRYFLCSEYGSKYGRPHYHLLIWNFPLSTDQLSDCWKNGFIKLGRCTEKSVQYCLKYFAIKQKHPADKNPNFCCMSKKIGYQWLFDNLHYVKEFVYMPGSNYKIPIPSIFRKKLNYPKREYTWQYEPDVYEYFSRKFLRSRGLLSRRIFNRMVVSQTQLDKLLIDSESYYFYRDKIFHEKYDKCNNKDNQ